MGRATRWLKALLGMKKDDKQQNNQFSENLYSVNGGEKREKKRWSFTKSEKGHKGKMGQIPMKVMASKMDHVWVRNYVMETEKEQSKHAIAVAAATAAAADAALAAAQAAAAVVRLTSHGRGTMFNGGRERWAVLKIQICFRGYLARKALRALKGLVKLQALVRGYLVRKRANATLHSIQALIRAQSFVRSQRAHRMMSQNLPEIRARRSMENYDETRSEYHSKRVSNNSIDDSPKIVEIDTFKPQSRSRRIKAMAIPSDSGEDYSPRICPKPRKLHDFEWAYNGDECNISTTHNTPRLANSTRINVSLTPVKSICGENSIYGACLNSPSYMANTQSFKAKLRSLSAPKQRPEPGFKKRLSLNEIMASRTSLSSVRMQG